VNSSHWFFAASTSTFDGISTGGIDVIYSIFFPPSKGAISWTWISASSASIYATIGESINSGLLAATWISWVFLIPFDNWFFRSSNWDPAFYLINWVSPNSVNFSLNIIILIPTYFIILFLFLNNFLIFKSFKY
jgi:hypothetical protein